MRIIHFNSKPYESDKCACGVEGLSAKYRELVTCRRCRWTYEFRYGED